MTTDDRDTGSIDWTKVREIISELERPRPAEGLDELQQRIMNIVTYAAQDAMLRITYEIQLMKEPRRD